jgi:hypothetical protein
MLKTLEAKEFIQLVLIACPVDWGVPGFWTKETSRVFTGQASKRQTLG